MAKFHARDLPERRDGEKKVLGILDSGMLQLFVFARLGAQGRNRTTDTAIFSRILRLEFPSI